MNEPAELTHEVTVRLTRAELLAVSSAAQDARVTVSSFIRQVAVCESTRPVDAVRWVPLLDLPWREEVPSG